jgi:cyclic pyranopterin phosphate synthase
MAKAERAARRRARPRAATSAAKAAARPAAKGAAKPVAKPAAKPAAKDAAKLVAGAAAPRLSHLDERSGEARMVDVAAKPVTAREAVARGRLVVSRAAMRLVRAGTLKKGDPRQVAKLAGILGAKQTSALIPLCHPLPLSSIDVEVAARGDGLDIEARVRTTAQTGVEMEALTAVAIAGLTLYDMIKAADKTMVLTDVRLVTKRGGQSGDFDADAARSRR